MQAPAGRRQTLLALSLILALGVFIRAFALNLSPPGLWFDEALNGLDAWKVWQPGGGLKLVYPDVFPREPFFETLLAFSVHLFGPKILAMRAISVVVGTIELLLLFGMLRAEAGDAVALTAAGVLAGLRWHVLFSRLIFRTLVLPGWITALVWTALAYRRWPNAWRAALFGLLAGGGFYTYLGWYFMLPFVIGVAAWISDLPYWITSFRRHGFSEEELADRQAAWKTGRLHLGLILIVSAATFAPLGFHYLSHPTDLLARPGEVSVFKNGTAEGLREIAKNAFEAALMFNWRGDHVPVQNVPHAAALDPIQGIFFVYGIVLAVAGIRRREPLPAILLGWLLCGTSATIFTYTDSPNFLRTLVVAPAAATLTAMGLVGAARFLASRSGKPASIAAVATVLAASMIWTGYDLIQWTNRPDVLGKFQHEVVVIGSQAGNQASPETAVFIPDKVLGSLPFQFQTLGKDGIYPYSDWSFLAPWPPTPETKDAAEPRQRVVYSFGAPGMEAALRKIARGKVSTNLITDQSGRLVAVSFAIAEDSLPDPAVVRQMVQAK